MASCAYILVVEDDLDIAESIEMILATRGYEIGHAANGLEALERCAERLPDVIVLDMLMPIMNGWEFARELAARCPAHRPPLLVVTAAEHARSRAAEVGADAFVKKPFAARTLLACVAAILSRSASAAEHRA